MVTMNSEKSNEIEIRVRFELRYVTKHPPVV